VKWICLLLLATLLGCSSPAEGDAIVVLLDLSASAQESRGRTVTAFDKILDEVGAATQLYVLGIEANSLVAPVELVLTPSPLTRSLFGTNSYTERRGLKQVRTQAAEQFRALLDRAPQDRPGSAIVDAIVRAHDLLGASGAGRRTLVVLSDGFEQGDLIDISGLQPIEVSPVLDQLKQAGRIPNLTGICVFFAGITEGDRQSPVSAGTVRAVGNFWRGYFEAAGAELALYDPSLVRFHPGRCAQNLGS